MVLLLGAATYKAFPEAMRLALMAAWLASTTQQREASPVAPIGRSAFGRFCYFLEVEVDQKGVVGGGH